MGSGKRIMSAKTMCRHSFSYGVKRDFVGFKMCAGTVLNVYGLPQIPQYTLSTTISPRINSPFVYIFLFINTVLAFPLFFSAIVNTMTKLIEGTQYTRRREQPTLAPNKFKEAVDCLLCSDPCDDSNDHLP